MIRVFIDTSGWAAYFNKKDSNHNSAVRIWNKLKEQNALLFTSDYVLDELFTLLKVRVNTDIAIKSGNGIRSSQRVKTMKITDEIFSGAIELFKKYKEHMSVSFTDCTSFETMRRVNIKIAFSFDKDFEIAGFEMA